MRTLRDWARGLVVLTAGSVFLFAGCTHRMTADRKMDNGDMTQDSEMAKDKEMMQT